VLLFTAFSQPAYSNSGHGLGLSIVKRIVEKLGGEVAAHSSGMPGEGSTFSSPCRRLNLTHLRCVIY
jgi:signal transduction histidine kinase